MTASSDKLGSVEELPCGLVVFTNKTTFIMFQRSFGDIFFLRSSIGGVAYVNVFNSSATWAATFHLRGHVSKVTATCVKLQSGEELPCGLVVCVCQ